MSEKTGEKVSIKMEKEKIFRCELGKIKVENLYIDEEHDDEEEMIGPNPSRMLGLAILGCLSASFEFCLKKREFKVKDLEAKAEIKFFRNEKGFWRVKQIDVILGVKTENPNDINEKKRIEQCLKVMQVDTRYFEQFCTVTESVRSGIKVDVKINVN